MLFNVAQLLREPIGARRAQAIDEVWTPDTSTAGDVTLRGPATLMRTDKGILVTASLASAAPGACDRCLQPMRYPMQLTIAEEYLPVIDLYTGAPLPADEDGPAPFRIDEHHTMDLEEAVRQAWLLATPMQTLCRDDCAGLCPDCGADRNAGPCRCAEAPVDARWAALAALRNTARNGGPDRQEG